MRLFLLVVVGALVLGGIFHAQIEQRLAQASAYLPGGAMPLGGVERLGHATGDLMTRVGNALSH